jgi:hypothetical protein
VWDLRYTPPAGAPRWGKPAVLGLTPQAPLGPLVLPGQYRVVLTAVGKEYGAPLTVKVDPNAGSTPTALASNVHFALALVSDIDNNAKVLQAAQAAANAADDGAGRQRIEDQVKKSDLDGINRQLSMLLNEVAENDEAPSPTVVDAANNLRASSGKARDALTGL